MSARTLLVIVLLTSSYASAWQLGRVRRDPMTDAEIEQMREYRDDPPKRLHVMVVMLQKRGETLHQLETDPKAVKPEERGQKTHDLLEDLTNLVDEWDENVDLFAKGADDVRKSLNEGVAEEIALQAQLKVIQAADKDNPLFEAYSFPLQDAIEALTGSLQSTHEAIDENATASKAAKQQQKKAK